MHKIYATSIGRVHLTPLNIIADNRISRLVEPNLLAGRESFPFSRTKYICCEGITPISAVLKSAFFTSESAAE